MSQNESIALRPGEAVLHPDEGILTAKAAEAIGADRINTLNSPSGGAGHCPEPQPRRRVTITWSQGLTEPLAAATESDCFDASITIEEATR